MQIMHYWKGVCFAKLQDFDNDGIKELILVYQNGSEAISEIKYHVELWTFDGKNTKKSVPPYHGLETTVNILADFPL